MKKKVVLLICLTIIPVNVFARRGCCSHHGGVAGCGSNGRQICNDGTYSPTCTCESYSSYTETVKQTDVYGCTDSKADNYNSNANVDDGSCKYTIYGCTNSSANNYNSNANKDDGSCTYTKYGCMDENATNYDSEATEDDNSCEYITNDENNESDENTTEESTNPIGPLAVLGGISGGIYYLSKKNKNK